MFNANEVIEYIDIESGTKRLMGNAKLYKRMLTLYLAGTELEQLKTALSENDLTAAANAAHAIKGVAGNLSLTKQFKLSEALMTELRQGERSEERINQFFAESEKTHEIVKSAIESMD